VSLPRRAFAAVFISLVTAAFTGGCGEPKVAKVGDETISLREFERQLRILKSLRPDTRADDMTRRQVLEQMVKQRLLTLEAKRLGLDKDMAVADSIRSQRQSVKDELLANIKNAQAQLDQLEVAVEQKVLIEKLLESKKASLPVTDLEVKKAYEARRAQARGAEKPLAQIRAQLVQQVQLEKLVDAAKAGQVIELFPAVAAQGKLED
jgi:hypothetical protein